MRSYAEPPPALDLHRLAEAIAAAPALLGRTRLVCVDGPAGSGKTTLATGLAERIDDATVLHMDDVYRGWDTDFDEVMARLLVQLVEPLSEQRMARFQRYDWYAERLDAWVDVPVPEVLLLEGVGSGGTALDPVRSLLIWIEADREVRIGRGIARDGPGMLPNWLAWMRHEEAEHARQNTRSRADVRLRSDTPADESTDGAAPREPQ
ncbi:MAG: uridine kinase family protein [Nocardioidaceae bacterium]